MILGKQDKIVFVFIVLFYSMLIWLVKDHQLFWDTVQFGGKHPNYFFYHPYSIILPNALDSGHIPAFGYYIALFWQIFGRSLSSTHWAMLPFLIGMSYQAYQYCKVRFDSSKWQWMAAIFLLLDPTLLAQSTLVSPDILLVFFFFLLLNTLNKDQALMVILSAIGLVLTSNRGVMVVTGVGMWKMYEYYLTSRKINLRMVWLFTPSAILFIAYHGFHYAEVGWCFYHDLSPWAPSFERATSIEMLKNSFLFGHRILDFGRVFLLLLLLMFWRRINWSADGLRSQLVLVIFLSIFLGYPFISHVGLNGHRYLLPIIMILELIWLQMVVSYTTRTKFYYAIGLTFLVFGNFWKYPASISQGWDASLRHLGYYKNQNQLYTYISHNRINPANVSSEFPNSASHQDQFISNKNIQLNSSITKCTDYVLITDMSKPMSKDSMTTFTLTKHFYTYGINFYLYKYK